MFRKDQDNQEEIEVGIINHNRFEKRAILDTVVLILVLSILVGLLLFALTMILAAIQPLILDVIAIAFMTLPAIGICALLVSLWRYIRKPQIITVAKTGTIVRLPDGNMQVISPTELFAFETRNSQVIALPAPIIESSVSNDRFQMETPQIGVSDRFPMETPAETPTETPVPVVDMVVTTLQEEKDKAKHDKEMSDRENTKQQIARLHELGVSMRNISKYVHMAGRKYTDFQQLCRELNIID